MCKVLLALSVQFSFIKLPPKKNIYQLCMHPRLWNELTFTDLEAFSSADSYQLTGVSVNTYIPIEFNLYGYS